MRSIASRFSNLSRYRRLLKFLVQSQFRTSKSHFETALRILKPTSVLVVGALVAGVVSPDIPGTFLEGSPRFYLHNDSPKDGLLFPQGRTYIAGARKEKALAEHPRKLKERDGTVGDKKDGETDNQVDTVSTTSSLQSDVASAWSHLVDGLVGAKETVTSVEWSSIPDTVTGYIVPDWFRELPGYISKLQREISMAPGSLADEIWQEAHDSNINPEVAWDAVVRVSNGLCDEERNFLRRRRQVTRTALAKYLGLKEHEINVEDVPTIAICGSGGGLRALLAGTGSYLSAQEAGLFGCVTYTAGVSGSCWLQTLYYSTLTNCRYDRLVEHIKSRIGVHIAFPPSALSLLTAAPTNKFLLRGMIEKMQADPKGSYGLVDVYGLLLAARLLVPKGELDVRDEDLKLSAQRVYIDQGKHPLPIYTAVRHEIPIEAEKAVEQSGVDIENLKESLKEKAKEESWFQWFEFTPYELWCEELHAGIPSWAVGRRFDGGRNLYGDDGQPSPQLKMPFLMGMWGSAFCATLSHYYQEIKPVVKGLIGFGGVDRLIEDRNEDLIKVHPIEPATIPNYVLGMKDQLPETCPESIHRSDQLQLMDAGMSNNLPIYPLLRPGRDVDIVIAFDASADIKTGNWLSVADGYARQRGIKGWPIGTGWPTSSTDTTVTVEKLEAAQASSAQEAADKVAEAKDEQQGHSQPTKDSPPSSSSELGYCTVWVGTTEERTSTDEPPPSKKVEADWELMEPHAGITVIYYPFLPNPKAGVGVEDIDPNTSDFMSTWNFVYTPDQVDQVIALARANFDEGKDQTKATVRAVYERKKKIRLQREGAQKMDRRRRKLRLGILSKKGDGDQFS